MVKKHLREKKNATISTMDDFQQSEQEPDVCTRRLRWASICGLGFFFAFLHRNHVANMFENDRHFSHLADFEREMTYRTEMGLYYSFYKTLIESPTFVDGFRQIIGDNGTEFGHSINTLKRFNLYPEVGMAGIYRIFRSMAGHFKWNVETCWQVNRGDDLAPVKSCEGLGNPHYFYINYVFLIAGITAALIFWFGILVSDSIWGGFLSIGSFFFNHGEATRVQWTPPLRESFGYPVFLFHMLIVAYVLKHKKSGFLWSSLITANIFKFMAFWQFAQFALTTQIGSLFLTFLLDFIPIRTMITLVVGNLIGFVCGFILLFGNDMLLTSLFLSSTLTTLLLLAINEGLRSRIAFRPAFICIQSALFLAGTLGLKFALAKVLGIDDDAHIFEILRAKFTDFANFHTRLYTCAVEFDFLGFETPAKLFQTLLLPSSLLALLLFLVYLIRTEYSCGLWKSLRQDRKFPHLMYMLVQWGCFTLMAVLIMRLKLFWTPHLCIMTSFLANRKLFTSALSHVSIRLTPTYHVIVLMALLSTMGYQGYDNLQQQWAIQGEYSNPAQEALFDWINANARKDAVFAGTMPLMANLKLSTGRPIVNHPHYEDAGLRDRTLKVYSIYSRKSPLEVHNILKQMGVNFFVFEYSWCGPNVQRPECSYSAIWDMVDPDNRSNPILCETIHNTDDDTLGPFQIVYNRHGYKILKVQ